MKCKTPGFEHASSDRNFVWSIHVAKTKKRGEVHHYYGIYGIDIKLNRTVYYVLNSDAISHYKNVHTSIRRKVKALEGTNGNGAQVRAVLLTA